MEETETKNKKYIEAVGRRKTSVARARLYETSKNSIIINDKDVGDYFGISELRAVTFEPLTKSSVSKKFRISCLVKGGGQSSQAGAIRHAIARALISHDPELRKEIKKLGFLKRDPRMKERRKFGLKKARKAPQWSKR
ncbi:MAG: 30S ribosomal protein S9 [Candidatus Zambryskibacteria bacterium CG_4_9_14_3_um_filter_40_16]|uniref:Small ribosomal subunit protein uS9 n=2 Tax=Candidatus Zambryskiibacteriota TaxID=1817925 RepID=A0A2H0K6M4_9BACT|nr:MAG: 30S ribosomal protein S9 [Candidatus Zambryskibacteria bacterium CG11_big_fil_rev_8_21_14_0_20_40_24]PJA33508.1 MAG: 30S ribosomal protein S9 [Candidatus Zambryskibacteria bacterium CG_4_9_14_3_um_filter_40_16]